MTNTDRIEKEIDLAASVERVWRALTDASEFGTWFRVELDGPFKVGGSVCGEITHPECKGTHMEVHVERMDERERFSFRWNPLPDATGPRAPSTLVEFTLQARPGGTRLRIVESGFDQLPPDKRDEAFRLNDHGWTEQTENIRAHVER